MFPGFLRTQYNAHWDIHGGLVTRRSCAILLSLVRKGTARTLPLVFWPPILVLVLNAASWREAGNARKRRLHRRKRESNGWLQKSGVEVGWGGLLLVLIIFARVS
jgi:hypothetical protein